jgi:hypothetical protein
MEFIKLSKKELRHIFLVGTHMHSFQGKNSSSVPYIIKDRGMIQYDPLNPAGRYHDHFLFNRIENYKQADFEKIAYKKKLIFEYYNPNLCALSIEHFPILWSLMQQRILSPYYQSRIDKLQSQKPTILDEVYDFVKNNGKTSGKDLSHLGKAQEGYASWKSNQTSSSVLEYLWVMGKLAVVERTSTFQKKYDLIENFIPKKFLFKTVEPNELGKFNKFQIIHKSYPVINARKVTRKDGKISFGKNDFVPEIDEDCDDFIIAKIEQSQKNVIIPNNYSDLLSQESHDDHIRLVGVLDPLIWDRELLKFVFNFEYTWEVYKKEKDRIWGYYVFPLLFQGIFIGRCELRLTTENNLKVLNLFNLTIEKGISITSEMKTAFSDLILRLEKFLAPQKINKDISIKILT